MTDITVHPTDISTNSVTEHTNMSPTHQMNTSTVETTTASIDKGGFHIPPEATFAIVFATCGLIIFGAVVYFIMRKGRDKPACTCLSCRKCLLIFQTRKRRSSTSSQGPLTQDDATFVSSIEPRHERELFSIADQDGGDDGRHDGRHAQRARRSTVTEDDYFYDEIFERSAFVDASTNRAIKQLTMQNEEDELELAGTDVPDLVFKKQY